MKNHCYFPHIREEDQDSMQACAHAKLVQWFLPCDPWTVAHEAPLSMGFSRKNTGVGCHVLLLSVCDIFQGHSAVK